MTEFSRAAVRSAIGFVLVTGFAFSPAVAQEATAEAKVDIDPGEIIAVGSSIDEATLREIFSGDVVSHAEALANWNAQSITLPLVTFTTHVGSQYNTVAYSDVVLGEIVDGVVSSMSIAGMDIDYDGEVIVALDTFTARDLNVSGLLAYYGLVPAADSEAFATIYRDVNLDGGQIDFDGGTCVVGPMSVGSFSARPLRTPFLDFLAFSEQLTELEEDDVPPETVRQLVEFYSDMITSFQSTEMVFESLACKGLETDNANVRFSFGPLTVGGFTPGIYPEVSLGNLELLVDDGESLSTILLGEGLFKGLDYGHVLSLLADIPFEDADDWFEANAHRFIPEFHGFAGTYLSYDGIDPDTGAPARFSLADFDLTLGAYVNSIPTLIKGHTRGLVLPFDTLFNEADLDPAAQALIASDLEELNISQWFDAEWDAEREVIVLRAYGVEVAGLGAVDISADVINATDDLFSLHEMRTMMAAMRMAVDNVTIEIADEGAVDLFIEVAATQAGVAPDSVRGIAVIGLREILAQEPALAIEGLLPAVENFLREGGTLTLQASSKSGRGVGMMDFALIEDDPLALIEKLDITVSWR